MKPRSTLSVLLVGSFITLIAAFWSLQTAQALVCYNGQHQVIPCPKTDYKNPTQPGPTSTPVPDPTSTVVQSGNGNCISNPPSNSSANPAPAAAGGSSPSPFSGLLFGAGGLLVGVLVGLFVPNWIGAPLGLARGVPPARAAGKVPSTGSNQDRPGGGC